mmetsp:Transcript_15400/g.25643  ORF Transcript_15400/g.25643 Transcript_15400/m.25643 type:complete len:739 (+) Transcript_15400:221-2437(+)
MKLTFLNAALFTLILLVLCSWCVLHDDISCVVLHASAAAGLNPNGYYVAKGGVYVRKGGQNRIAVIPDFFGLVALSMTAGGDDEPVLIISQDRHRWLIQAQSRDGKGVHRRELYHSSPKHAQQYLFQPPPGDWVQVPTAVSSSATPSELAVRECRGSLADSPPVTGAQSNLSELLARPVTVLIMTIIFAVAYLLWARRVPVSAVAFSYEAVTRGGEYWRMLSASFAHFEVLHLAFNCMSFYQLGQLEEVFGSVAFFYLNADLVVLTMVVCVLLYHVLITRFDKQHLVHQQAVGYSCVLFSWMVAASVRMQEFCPLFFMPSLCFPTWLLPLPLSVRLPVNLGPFVLLVITKLILPQSSLTGHLAGIIVGFPLAWGMVDWLTPPLLGAALAWSFVHVEHLWVWTLPGYTRSRAARSLVDDNTGSVRRNYTTGEGGLCMWAASASDSVLQEFVPPTDLQAFRLLRLTFAALLACTITLPLCLVVPGDSLLEGLLSLTLWLQMAPRVMLLGLVAMSVEARRCEWLTSLHSTQVSCSRILGVTGLLTLLTISCDVTTLTGLLTSITLLQASGGVPPACFVSCCLAVTCLVLLQGAVLGLLVRCMQCMPATAALLEKLGLDAASVHSSLLQLGLSRSTNPFDGRAQVATLASPSTVMPVATASSVPSPSHHAGWRDRGQTPAAHLYSALSHQEEVADTDQQQRPAGTARSQRGGMSEAGIAALARLGGTGGGRQYPSSSQAQRK